MTEGTDDSIESAAAVRRATAEISEARVSLLWLVILGTIGVTLVGAALFLWLAWLQSKQVAPWHSRDWDWAAWMAGVDGPKWFDSARTTATILAIVGVGAAALVAYRRQDTTELSHRFTVEAHQTEIEAQQTAVEAQKTATQQAITAAEQAATAARQLELDSKKYDLDMKRHELEVERRQDDRERELRSRFTVVAEQISGKPAVRLAGVYALAALADDWHGFGNDTERQVCVSLMCAQLRSASQHDDPADAEFRKTMVTILRQHRPTMYERNKRDETEWYRCTLDLTGADLRDADLNFADLNAAKLTGADLTCANLFRAEFGEADLTGANLTDANLTATEFSFAVLVEAIFTGTNLLNVKFFETDLKRANFRDASLLHANFFRADLTGADFTGAKLHGAKLNAVLTNAILTNADLTGADFTGATVYGANFDGANLANATLDGIYDGGRAVWPKGFVPPEQPPQGE